MLFDRRVRSLEVLIAPRRYGLVTTLTPASAPLPLAFVAQRAQLYGQLARNPVTVMGLAAPDAVANASGPSGSHETV